MARPIRRAPPVTRATPRAAEAPEAAGTSVNPTELDQVHQGHDGDEAEDDAESQHGDPPVSPRLRGRRGAVQARMGESLERKLTRCGSQTRPVPGGWQSRGDARAQETCGE